MELQKDVLEFCERHNLKHNPETWLLDLVSEVGELAKSLLKATNYGKAKLHISKEVEEELGDVCFSLLALANELGLDLEKALIRVLKKYERRIKSRGTPAS